MSDDLMLRLRNCYNLLEDEGHYVKANTVHLAIDRIEALTEQLEAARLDAKEAEAYSVWLEGKLQKTVTALQKVRNFVRDMGPYMDQGHTIAPALYEACAILNELEGYKDD